MTDIDKTRFLADEAQAIEEATSELASIDIEVNGSLGDRIVVKYLDLEHHLESETGGNEDE
jgi:hypothetical protein